MGLKDALEANKTMHRGPKCTLCILLNKMDPKEQAVLQSALDDEAYTHAAIGRALQAEGYAITANTVQRHRSRGCVTR